MKKEVLIHGSRIKKHEDNLKYFELRKTVFEDLVQKDREELLQIQG